MDLYDETKFLLKKYNIIANKRLGQNFLIDEEAVKTAVEASNIKNTDLVIEIGPGLGTLTQEILKKAGKVICIELDEKMISILNDRFILYNNFEIINEDILKVDLKKLLKEQLNQNITKAKVVANLPYYITTPIIMKLLEEKLQIESITVMVQKEVADRLIAKPGDTYTGAITYSINYYTIPERILDVEKEAFLPAPEVNSSIIKLNVLQTPQINVRDEKMLFKVIKLAFMQKRKTLINALSNGNILGDKKQIENMLEEIGVDLKIRGEKLSLEQFAKIADYITTLKYNK